MSDLSEGENALCYSFKESTICAGLTDGVRLIKYQKATELGEVTCHDQLKAYLVELVPEYNTLIYVPYEARDTVRFYNYEKRQELTDRGPIQCESNVVRIKANTSRILIAAEKAIYIYTGYENGLRLLKTIEISGTLSSSLVDISFHSVKTHIAYPNFDIVGNITIDHLGEYRGAQNTEDQEQPRTFTVHDNELVAIAMDPFGRNVATASQRGVLIKVHNIFSGECKFEFRRGLCLGTTVTSLTYSPDARFVFSHDTARCVKIFKLGYEMSISTKGSYWVYDLLQRVTEPYLAEDASAWLFKPETYAEVKILDKNIVALTSTKYTGDLRKIYPHILLGTKDGLIYTYEIDIGKVGQCTFKGCFDAERKQYVEKSEDEDAVNDE